MADSTQTWWSSNSEHTPESHGGLAAGTVHPVSSAALVISSELLTVLMLLMWGLHSEPVTYANAHLPFFPKVLQGS